MSEELFNRNLIGIIKIIAIFMSLFSIFFISGLCVFIETDSSNNGELVSMFLLVLAAVYLFMSFYVSVDLCNICINNCLKKRKDRHVGHPI